MKKISLLSLLFSLSLFACDNGNVEICNNDLDDNGDALIDCNDPLCANDVVSCVVSAEVCDDNIDNDRDNALDCADADCDVAAICQELGSCADGIDNDVDNLTDCFDSDCAGDPLCIELCNDNQDNDADTFIDCQDSDCLNDPLCQNVAENCTNGADDDRDTRLDCFDPDCAVNAACALGSENCTDNIDNDADNLVDCADPNCGQSLDCNAAAVGFGAALQPVLVGSAPTLGDAPEFFGATCPNGSVCAGNTPECGTCDGGATFTCFADVDPATLSCCVASSGAAIGGFCANGNTCAACGDAADTVTCVAPDREAFCVGADPSTCPAGDTLVSCETRNACFADADVQAGLACGICGDEIILTAASNAVGGIGCCATSDGTVNGDIFCDNAQTCFTCDDATFSCIDPAIGFCQ
jgi:hypothetical protein